MVWPIIFTAGRTAIAWTAKQALKHPILSATAAHIATDGKSTKAIRQGTGTAIAASAAAIEQLNPEARQSLSDGFKDAATSTTKAWSEMASEGTGLAGDLGMKALEGSDISSLIIARRSPARASVKALSDEQDAHTKTNLADVIEKSKEVSASDFTPKIEYPEDDGGICSNILSLNGGSLNSTFNNISDAIGDETLHLSSAERMLFNVCWAFAHVADFLDQDGSTGSALKMAAISITKDDVAEQMCSADLPIQATLPQSLKF